MIDNKSNEHPIICNDIISFIFSEFFYFKDFLNLTRGDSFFLDMLYCMNFENNDFDFTNNIVEKMKTMSYVNFDTFNVSPNGKELNWVYQLENIFIKNYISIIVSTNPFIQNYHLMCTKFHLVFDSINF